MTAAHRFCEYRECGVCIDHMRPNASYCDSTHKDAERRAREGDPAGTSYPVGKPRENARRAVRRPNRDGHGTRLYVVGAEAELIRDLLAGKRPRSSRARDRLERKIPAALERIGRRAA